MILLSILTSVLYTQLKVLEESRSLQDRSRLIEMHIYFQSLVDMTETIVIRGGIIYFDDLDNKGKDKSATKKMYFETHGEGVYRHLCYTDSLEGIGGSGEAHQRFAKIRNFSLVMDGADLVLRASAGNETIETYIFVQKTIIYIE